MKDDTRKPYKMYAAVASAVLSSFVADKAVSWNPWVEMLMVGAVAGLSVFLTPNPKVP